MGLKPAGAPQIERSPARSIWEAVRCGPPRATRPSLFFKVVLLAAGMYYPPVGGGGGGRGGGGCDCAGGPTPLTDWACGDVVCSACGVVVEGHILDESPEWRNHGGGDDHSREDRSRVGPADPRGRLGTYLATGVNKRMCRGLAGREDPKEVALTDGLKTIDRFVGFMRLSTTSTIAATAKELFTDLHEAKGVRGDNRRAAAAAAVYYGCKLENSGRELRLVSTVCQVDPRALNAATSEYKAELAAKAYYPRLFATLQAGKLIDVFLDRLVAGGGLAAGRRKAVWRAAHQLDEVLMDGMDCGRKPRTICSGILFVAAQQEGVAVGKKDITEACSVCQQTLDKVVAQIKATLAKAPAPLL